MWPQKKAKTYYNVNTCGDSPPEEDLPFCDFLIVFKWDVPTHHVIQQDAQRPDCGRAAMIAMVLDPLRWAVHSRACREEI